MLLFEYKIDKKKKGSGLTGMSIVELPAVEVNFIALSKEPLNEIKLSVDEDKHIITGPAMIPDIKIFRSKDTLGLEEDGYIYFTSETIKEMSEIFLENELMNSTSIDHEVKTKDIKLIESWIILDNEKDKACALGFNLPKGTWMTSYKVYNEQLWSDIKEGKINGFSIEAIDMERIPIEMAKEKKPKKESAVKKIGKWLVPKDVETFEWQVGDNDNHCPHCLKAQHIKPKSRAQWSSSKYGTPRSGKTYCKHNCQCKLVPAGEREFIFSDEKIKYENLEGVDLLKPDIHDTEKKFLNKCIPYVLENGEAGDEKQAYAMCKSMWDGLSEDESEFNNEDYVEEEFGEDDILDIFDHYLNKKK